MQRDITEVAPGVLVTTSRRDATTSSVIVSGDEAVLVDPAWDPDELDWLAELVVGLRYRVRAGISTHAHHDHLLWHPAFGTAPRYASPRTVELADTHRGELLAALGPEWPPRLASEVARLVSAGVDGDVPFARPLQLVTHDGHAPGHVAVWLPEARVLLAGDMLSDRELPLPFDPDDLPAYLAGLDTLAPFVRRARVLVPGHGRPTTDPLARLDADRRYLDALASGFDPDDPRRANPGMAEVHARLLMLARPS
jgi:glyoxylase-like metal-dependent hydrolase (beta-lactamase superfamily II)